MPHIIEEFKEQRRLHRLIIYKSTELRKLLRLLHDLKTIPSEHSVVFDSLYELHRGDPYAEPTMYDGVAAADLDTKVRSDLRRLIVPSSTMPRLPAVPNFFLEIKDPLEHPKLLFDRAVYHGCLGARGMSRLRNYRVDEPVYDGTIETMSLTYDAQTGELNMYDTHIINCETPGVEIEYRTAKRWGYRLFDNEGGLENAKRAFSAARDLSKKRRDLRVGEANAKIKEMAEAKEATEAKEAAKVEEPAKVEEQAEVEEPAEVKEAAEAKEVAEVHQEPLCIR